MKDKQYFDTQSLYQDTTMSLSKRVIIFSNYFSILNNKFFESAKLLPVRNYDYLRFIF